MNTLIPCFPISLPQNGLKSHTRVGSSTRSPGAVSHLPAVTDFPGYLSNLACAQLCFPDTVRAWQAMATDRVWSIWIPWWQGLCLCPGNKEFREHSSPESRCIEEHIMYESLLSAPKIYWRYCQYLTSNWGLPWGLLQSVPSLAHSLLPKLAGNEFQSPAVLLLLLHLQESQQE